MTIAFCYQTEAWRSILSMVASMFTAAQQDLVRAIVALRKKAGMSQRALAEALGREQNYVGRIETKQRRVDLIELVQICRACGADPNVEIPILVKQIASSVPQKRRKAL